MTRPCKGSKPKAGIEPRFVIFRGGRGRLAATTCCLTKSQHTDTGPTSPLTPGTWKGSHWSIRCFGFFVLFCFTVSGLTRPGKALLLVGCLTSQLHAGLSQGRINSDKFTCCYIEIEVTGYTFYLTQTQYIDTRPTSSSADPITPGAWQGSQGSANF